MSTELIPNRKIAPLVITEALSQWLKCPRLGKAVIRYPYSQMQPSELTARLGPGKFYGTDAMFAAIGARRLGMKNGPVLAGVQMPPAPLLLVIMKFAWLTAFRTGLFVKSYVVT